MLINDKTIICGDKHSFIEVPILENCSIKEILKKTVFKYLYNKTGNELPWGTLVGIRPSKIALALIDNGLCEDAIC